MYVFFNQSASLFVFLIPDTPPQPKHFSPPQPNLTSTKFTPSVQFVAWSTPLMPYLRPLHHTISDQSLNTCCPINNVVCLPHNFITQTKFLTSHRTLPISLLPTQSKLQTAPPPLPTSPTLSSCTVLYPTHPHPLDTNAPTIPEMVRAAAIFTGKIACDFCGDIGCDFRCDFCVQIAFEAVQTTFFCQYNNPYTKVPHQKPPNVPVHLGTLSPFRIFL